MVDLLCKCHKLSVYQIYPFTKFHSTKFFTVGKNLMKYMRTHSEESSLPCTVCNKSSTQGRSLKLRRKTFSMYSMYQILHSGCKFKDRHENTFRQKTFHMYSMCQNFYRWCIFRSIHEYTFREKNLFPVQYVTKPSKRVNLYKYTWGHFQENHFSPCTVCTKFFREGRSLKVHMRTHLVEKTFPLVVCT